MADTLPSLKLTSDGAMKLLNAAMAKAKEMGVSAVHFHRR